MAGDQHSIRTALNVLALGRQRSSALENKALTTGRHEGILLR